MFSLLESNYNALRLFLQMCCGVRRSCFEARAGGEGILIEPSLEQAASQNVKFWKIGWGSRFVGGFLCWYNVVIRCLKVGTVIIGSRLTPRRTEEAKSGASVDRPITTRYFYKPLKRTRKLALSSDCRTGIDKSRCFASRIVVRARRNASWQHTTFHAYFYECSATWPWDSGFAFLF